MSKMNNLAALRDESRIKFSQIKDILFTDVVELHGDRLYGDDKAIFTGLAYLGETKCLLIGQQKGLTTTENIAYNFGMPHPEGYRKVDRMISHAEKFKLPIIMFIDTPGAYPGLESEKRGQGSAIAQLLYKLCDCKTPIISIIISEGGSGGALGLGISDYIIGFENCYYSVISPEGYAEILYKNKKTVAEIIDDLDIFTPYLYENKIIDYILKEPEITYDQKLWANTLDELQIKLETEISRIQAISIDQLLLNRHNRYANYGRKDQ